MSILAWIEDQRKLKLLNAPKYTHPSSDGSKGLWTRCDHCGVILYIKHLKENQRVCFGCGYHLQMESQERIEHLIDDNTWRPLDETLSPCDPLEFRDQKLYTERLKDAQDRTGLQDAVQTGTGMLDGIPIALGVMDFHFMGGSMGSVVGEKITRLIEYATQEGLTLILVCASGGARMQEGIFSLMQMAKISSALQIYQSCANLLYISVLTSPTTGGVTASFAMLGDLIFAEPKALIGFAGRRVIEQTLQEELPNDFQTSEYLLHHGLLDLIVPRCFLKQALSETITLYKDAPFKRSGSLPYGVQSSLYFLTEEKARRKWHEWSSSSANKPGLPSFLEQLESEGRGAAPPPPSSSPSRDLIDISLRDCTPGALDRRSMGRPQGITSIATRRFSEGDRTPSRTFDPALAKTFATWLLDISSDTPYRDILMSFQAMFSVFPYASVDSAFGTDALSQELAISNALPCQPEASQSMEGEAEAAQGLKPALYSQEVEAKEGARVAEVKSTLSNPQDDSSATLQTHLDSNDSSSFPHRIEDFLSDALALGTKETIGWRAFYTNQKIPPKLRFLEHLRMDKMEGASEEPENAEVSNAEKKLFYRMVMNRSGVWKEGS